MTDKTRWLGLGPWHEDNESELIDWTAQPQYKGLVKGDYYHAELRYSGRWGDPGHKGELDVVFDDDGKIAFAEFNETTMGNYYVRHFQNVSKRRTEFQFFQDFHDKRRSVAYGRVLANGFKYVEDQILEKQDLDADYDLLTGASFSMKNMIGLKNDVSAQRKDSNHKKQRYYGYTEDYGYGITGWLQVVVEDGKIVRCFYDEIFADHTKDIVYDDLKQFYHIAICFGRENGLNMILMKWLTGDARLVSVNSKVVFLDEEDNTHEFTVSDYASGRGEGTVGALGMDLWGLRILLLGDLSVFKDHIP